MTAGCDDPGTRRKRERFVIHEGEVEVTGRHEPDPEEVAEAEGVFSRILKNRKQAQE